ncbi:MULTISPECIES: alpha/beta fold hydrolase [Salegentibacter]|uniref:Alpha/beta fold hydrolase n=1 Tax=Salegentibacter maritimus TaxID=2794347 RepID=A0ABS0TEK2_9FLAO|nr:MULTISPECIES: alpha/beta fold hydrolase [Salegentibacter]MBE7640991.1 alpha/beta fold hydrolase [Salegentibacter sp. BLCTC]MBI6116071.1 alpha/beta fold hydrolase [Salegentibacter maritimus]MBI6119481.1 alpha/beta fold hydrolase [Salegentibacter maritimus]
MLQELCLKDFRNSAGTVQDIHLSFQQFGQSHKTAPVVLINHALTGNSQITGKLGWWTKIVGENKSVDTNKFSILAFNIPGNGFNGKKEHLIENYKEFTLADIARIQALALERLEIEKLFAIIGGSIGGALAWELAALKPDLAEHIIPIATDYKATDWVLANCKVQGQILNNSNTPVKDARMHAMTFYRTPQSLSKKFNRSKEELEPCYKVEGWLQYHGKKLEERFQLASYKLMNHLLTTIDISKGSGKYLEAAKKIKGDIHIVTVNSDWFFLADENWDTYVNLSLEKNNVSIHEIKSIHGHDAFLIEAAQLSRFLKPVFKTNIKENEKSEHHLVWDR